MEITHSFIHLLICVVKGGGGVQDSPTLSIFRKILPEAPEPGEESVSEATPQHFRPGPRWADSQVDSGSGVTAQSA